MTSRDRMDDGNVRAAIARILRRAAKLRVPPQTLLDWADGIEEGEPYDEPYGEATQNDAD